MPVSGTNTGDNATNTQYSDLVTNATHTGDATGSTALTVVKINGTLMSGLATGILKNTTGTGVPSIAVAADFPVLNQDTVGGTINNTPIGGTTPAAGAFTTVSATLDGVINNEFFSLRDTASNGKEWGLYNRNGGTAGEFCIRNVTDEISALYLSASGNIGIGVTPSAWIGYQKSLDFGGAGNYGGLSSRTDNVSLGCNAYINSSAQWIYKNSNPASEYVQIGGAHYWNTAITGTAGNALAFNRVMAIDANGNLSVGPYGTSHHLIIKAVSDGSNILSAGNGIKTSFRVFASGNDDYNAAATTIALGKNGSTSRSINAAGTINASGADYAEYERNNGLKFVKGDIVGFGADGTLTNVFADAIRFGIKSTNPSYVGGDTWGSEEVVGKRPEEPQRIPDRTEQKLVSDAIPAVAEVLGADGVVIVEAAPAVVTDRPIGANP